MEHITESLKYEHGACLFGNNKKWRAHEVPLACVRSYDHVGKGEGGDRMVSVPDPSNPLYDLYSMRQGHDVLRP